VAPPYFAKRKNISISKCFAYLLGFNRLSIPLAIVNKRQVSQTHHTSAFVSQKNSQGRGRGRHCKKFPLT